MTRRAFWGRPVLWITAAALVAIAAASGYAWLQRWLDAPIAGIEAPVVVDLPRGSSLPAIARKLAAAGVLEHENVWRRYVAWRGLGGKLKAGEYEFLPGLTPRRLTSQLVAGDVVLHSVALVEGWTFAQARAVIAAHPAVTVTLAGLDDRAVAERLEFGTASPEGQLLPDTYRFSRGATDAELLQMAHVALDEALADAWSKRAASLPLATPYELLTLASIVEKETGAADERPEIAGVFVNRLRIGMRLQTDPTVIYGLGARFDGNLRRVDLLTDTPWNTYTRKGLPPTPIALAGRAAIAAAAQPASTEAIYFVATGDGDGRHRFARTLEEHNRNVKTYLRNLRSRTAP